MNNVIQLIYSANLSVQEQYNRLYMLLAKMISNCESVGDILLESAEKDPVITAACIRTLHNHIPEDAISAISLYFSQRYKPYRSASKETVIALADEALVKIVFDGQKRSRITKLVQEKEFNSDLLKEAYYNELSKYLSLKCITDEDRIRLLYSHYFNMQDLGYYWIEYDLYKNKNEIYQINDLVVEMIQDCISRGRYLLLVKLADRFPLLSLNNLCISRESLYSRKIKKWRMMDAISMLFFSATMIERSDIVPEDLDSWKVQTRDYINDPANGDITDKDLDSYLELITVYKKIKHFPKDAVRWIESSELKKTSRSNQFLKALHEEAFKSIITMCPEEFPSILKALGENNLYAYSEKHDYISGTALSSEGVGNEIIKKLRSSGLTDEEVIYCYFNSNLKSVYPLVKCLQVLYGKQGIHDISGIMKNYPVYGRLIKIDRFWAVKPFTYRGEGSAVYIRNKTNTHETVSCIINVFDGNIVRSSNVKVTEKSLTFRTSREYTKGSLSVAANLESLLNNTETNNQKMVLLMILYATESITTNEFNKYASRLPTSYNMSREYRLETIPEQCEYQRFLIGALFKTANSIPRMQAIINRIGNYRYSKSIFSYGAQPSEEEFLLILNSLHSQPKIGLYNTLKMFRTASDCLYEWENLTPEKIAAAYNDIIKMELSYDEIHTMYFNTILKYIVPIDHLIRDTYRGDNDSLKNVYGTRLQLSAMITSCRMISENQAEINLWHTLSKKQFTVLYCDDEDERGIRIDDITPGLYTVKFQHFDPKSNEIHVIIYQNEKTGD